MLDISCELPAKADNSQEISNIICTKMNGLGDSNLLSVVVMIGIFGKKDIHSLVSKVQSLALCKTWVGIEWIGLDKIFV